MPPATWNDFYTGQSVFIEAWNGNLHQMLAITSRKRHGLCANPKPVVCPQSNLAVPSPLGEGKGEGNLAFQLTKLRWAGASYATDTALVPERRPSTYIDEPGALQVPREIKPAQRIERPLRRIIKQHRVL